MLKKVAIILAFGYSVALATACLITLNNLPEVSVSNADKIFHFLSYGLFTMLWYFAFFFTFNIINKKAIIYAFVWAVCFGISIEILQETMTDSRALDVYDVLANTLGALMASLLLWAKNCLGVKKV